MQAWAAKPAAWSPARPTSTNLPGARTAPAWSRRWSGAEVLESFCVRSLINRRTQTLVPEVGGRGAAHFAPLGC